MNSLTIFQFFHWYYSTEGNLWLHAAEKASQLAELGITHVWLPPAYKSAMGADEPGYAVYDLFDLGEFDQKGSVRTRYGTKQEYLDAIKACHAHGISVLADIVLNHKHGGDEKETVPVVKVNPNNRKEPVSDHHSIEAHTRFTFPGRNGKYSDYQWDWHSFTGTREDSSDEIFLILNEYSNGNWEEMLEEEQGNFDYLMGNDIDFRNPHVREELKHWGRWYTDTTGVDGYRLDALKHIHHGFFPDWLEAMKAHAGKDMLCIGEYWQNNQQVLLRYIDVTSGKIQLFDVPLHFNFYEASLKGGDFDMRTIFDGTLTAARPTHAITFVDNHDTQPLQALQSTVEFWFKPLAYALILLREQGIPTVFYPAMYEAKYFDHSQDQEVYVEMNQVPGIETMLQIRKDFAYGGQHDYFDHHNVIGWTRLGTDEKAGSGCAVLLSNGDDGEKRMSMGQHHAGKTFIDVTGGRLEKVCLDDNGEGLFFVNGRAISVWIGEQYR